MILLTILSITPIAYIRASEAIQPSSPYLYNFNSSGSLQEAGSSGESSSPYWWLNSGGYLKINAGRGSTVIGPLSNQDPQRILYALTNSLDTDGGYHTQNVFRLLSRSLWGDIRQEAYFVVKKDNLSASQNRNSSNGLLLFNRYQDSDNLYYTGIRVDGSAVIKKKKNGIYYTMAQVKGIYPGNYERISSPNLLPKDKWIGLRSEVINRPNGSVEIKLYIDKGWQGKWDLVASVIDNGEKYGGSALLNNGYIGIRTDFMDVEFENFRARSIDSFAS